MPRESASILEDPSTCACYNTRKAARALTYYYDNIMRRSGLRITQFTLLTMLRSTGAMTINQLADATATDRTTLSRNVAVLRRRRLVRVEPGRDARVRLVAITESGESAYQRALPAWRWAQRATARRMGVRRLEALINELTLTAMRARP